MKPASRDRVQKKDLSGRTGLFVRHCAECRSYAQFRNRVQRRNNEATPATPSRCIRRLKQVASAGHLAACRTSSLLLSDSPVKSAMTRFWCNTYLTSARFLDSHPQTPQREHYKIADTQLSLSCVLANPHRLLDRATQNIPCVGPNMRALTQKQDRIVSKAGMWLNRGCCAVSKSMIVSWAKHTFRGSGVSR
jgi:hypothetical protein